jgi:hypothetical protein
MGKKQTDASKYPSRYSPDGWVRADQYIIELICEKKARTLNKDLPTKFWNNPEWEKFFKSQLRKCKSLLQKYSAEAIIKGLQDKKAWKIYSLHAPWLPKIIENYQVEIDKPKIVEELPEMSTGAFIRPNIKKKSTIDLLKELE